jgi:hypothetical protein
VDREPLVVARRPAPGLVRKWVLAHKTSIGRSAGKTERSP